MKKKVCLFFLLNRIQISHCVMPTMVIFLSRAGLLWMVLPTSCAITRMLKSFIWGLVRGLNVAFGMGRIIKGVRGGCLRLLCFFVLSFWLLLSFWLGIHAVFRCQSLALRVTFANSSKSNQKCRAPTIQPCGSLRAMFIKIWKNCFHQGPR